VFLQFGDKQMDMLHEAALAVASGGLIIHSNALWSTII